MLTQGEADFLHSLEKQFESSEVLPFALSRAFDLERDLLSVDRREKFILTIERGRRRRARLKYQTRARKIVVLARLDIDGPAHRNPRNAPHRPGERLLCPHIHIYHEKFGDGIAYALEDVPGYNVSDYDNGTSWLMDFLNFCRVNPATVPKIQVEI
jgi:hypothetical protein